MSKKYDYHITLINWEKHNGNHKKGHTHFLLSKRFFDDAKVQRLPLGGKLLFIGLIGACSDLCSTSMVGSHDLLVRLAGGSGQVIDRLLALMQELQLLTYEKKPAFIKAGNAVKQLQRMQY